MKKAIIFTILISSLVITGCIKKTSPVFEDVGEQVIDDRQQTTEQEQQINIETEIEESAKTVEGTEGWQVYEKEDMDVRLKYHKDWYYQRYNDERSEGYDLFVGFAPDPKMLDYTEPYPIEFVIVSSDNVGDSDSGLLIAERKGKLYKLYTIDKKKYGDILDKMAESFEFLDGIEINN